MLARLSLAISLSFGLSALPSTQASPITYAFSGTFDRPFFDGSNQFSGSFTIDEDPGPAMGGSRLDEGNIPVTLYLGGRAVPLSWGSLPGQPYTLFEGSVAKGTVAYAVEGVYGEGEPYAFSLIFSRPGGAMQPSDLASLNSSSFSTQVFASYEPAEGGDSHGYMSYWASAGSLTSIELVSAPEPGTLVVFGVMALGALVCRRVSRRSS